jgi:hypothetical protein
VGFPVVIIGEEDERLGRLRVDRRRVGGMPHLRLHFEMSKMSVGATNNMGQTMIKLNTKGRVTKSCQRSALSTLLKEQFRRSVVLAANPLDVSPN